MKDNSLGERVQEAFSTRLKEQRLAMGLSQGELGELVDVSRGSISYYEAGLRVPDILTLAKLAKTTDCSVDYLLGNTQSKNPNCEKIIDTYQVEDNLIASKLYRFLQTRTFKAFITACSESFFEVLDKNVIAFLDELTAEKQTATVLSGYFLGYFTDVFTKTSILLTKKSDVDKHDTNDCVELFTNSDHLRLLASILDDEVVREYLVSKLIHNDDLKT